MNKIIYKISTFHQGVLNKVKGKFKESLLANNLLRLYNLSIYFKWQANNHLNMQQNFKYVDKKFTVLRSPFVNKKSREQFSILYYGTFVKLFSILNFKYSFSKYNLYFLPINFKEKQYYIQEKRENCYLFKK